MEIARQILYGLLPSIGIGIFFYKIMKLLMESDRKERAAYRHWLADHDARADLQKREASAPAARHEVRDTDVDHDDVRR